MVVDRLTKSAYHIPIKISYPLQKLAKLYIDNVVSLHGIPSSIVSDRDMRFTSRFWSSLEESMGTKLKVEFSLSSSERRSDKEDYPVFGGFVESMFWSMEVTGTVTYR